MRTFLSYLLGEGYVARRLERELRQVNGLDDLSIIIIQRFLLYPLILLPASPFLLHGG